MKREYRVVVKEDNYYYPQFRYVILGLSWVWRYFYYSRNDEPEDYLYIRNFKEESEARDWLYKKSQEKKFTQVDTERGGED